MEPVSFKLLHGNETQRFTLRPGEDDCVTIGRDPKCDLPVNLSGVSRNHAELRLCERRGEYRLAVVDLSSNATGLKAPDGSITHLEPNVATEVPEGTLVVLPMKIKASEQDAVDLRMAFAIEMEPRKVKDKVTNGPKVTKVPTESGSLAELLRNHEDLELKEKHLKAREEKERQKQLEKEKEREKERERLREMQKEWELEREEEKQKEKEKEKDGKQKRSDSEGGKDREKKERDRDRRDRGRDDRRDRRDDRRGDRDRDRDRGDRGDRDRRDGRRDERRDGRRDDRREDRRDDRRDRDRDRDDRYDRRKEREPMPKRGGSRRQSSSSRRNVRRRSTPPKRPTRRQSPRRVERSRSRSRRPERRRKASSSRSERKKVGTGRNFTAGPPESTVSQDLLRELSGAAGPPSIPVTPGLLPRPGVEMCADFKRGACHRGDRCKFSHGREPLGEMCADFKRGACFREHCKFSHEGASLGPSLPLSASLSALPSLSARLGLGLEMCADFKRGACQRERCKFSHGDAPKLSEVQPLSLSSPQSPSLDVSEAAAKAAAALMAKETPHIPQPREVKSIEVGSDVQFLHNGSWTIGTALAYSGDGEKLTVLTDSEQLEVPVVSVRRPGAANSMRSPMVGGPMLGSVGSSPAVTVPSPFGGAPIKIPVPAPFGRPLLPTASIAPSLPTFSKATVGSPPSSLQSL
eukprot:s1422_g21.t1